MEELEGDSLHRKKCARGQSMTTLHTAIDRWHAARFDLHHEASFFHQPHSLLHTHFHTHTPNKCLVTATRVGPDSDAAACFSPAANSVVLLHGRGGFLAGWTERGWHFVMKGSINTHARSEQRAQCGDEKRQQHDSLRWSIYKRRHGNQQIAEHAER